MKYRRLTREEFEEVQPEFVRYLASQGIPSEEWALRLVKQEGLDEHLDAFSELFFDRATAEITHLVRENGDESWYFAFDERTAQLARVRSDGTWMGEGSKSYEPEARGREVFLLLEQGARPCDEADFERAQQRKPR